MALVSHCCGSVGPLTPKALKSKVPKLPNMNGPVSDGPCNQDSETRKQILNEMRTLCDNPNAPGLVKFFGAYYVADSGTMCIALEYMNGGKSETFWVLVFFSSLAF